MTPITEFLGDGTYSFALSRSLQIELEAKTGASIGKLSRRFFDREFALSDLSEVIRLALIGGGMAPKLADQKVQIYVADRPLAETYPIAIAILEAVWFGQPNEKTNG